MRIVELLHAQWFGSLAVLVYTRPSLSKQPLFESSRFISEPLNTRLQFHEDGFTGKFEAQGVAV
jgi:hypothetical protein